MFELSQLVQLIAFAKYETLSTAAEKLLISQPALSRSMQRLENELDVTLFERKKNKIELNDNGRLAVECAEKVMYDVENMIDRIRAYDRSKRTVFIGSCAPAPMWKLSPLLSELYPDYAISAEMKDSEYLTRSLQNGVYQIIITTRPISRDDVLCFEYCTEQLMVSLPPAHPLAMYKEISFKDLSGETMLMFSEIGFWHDVCSEHLPDTEFILQNERTAFEVLIRASSLPCFTSDLVLRDDESENRVIVPITDAAANPTFYFSIKKDNRARFSKLIEYIQNNDMTGTALPL